MGGRGATLKLWYQEIGYIWQSGVRQLGVILYFVEKGQSMVVSMMDGDKVFLHAIEYAIRMHEGQLDDCGEDYYDAHVAKVGQAVLVLTDDPEVIAAAYLHDTIEDTEATYEKLVELFGTRVADLVMEVTHEGTNDNYGYYFPRLHSQDGILIKLCDRASNISRMESWNEGRKAQYLKKTKFWKDGEDR